VARVNQHPSFSDSSTARWFAFSVDLSYAGTAGFEYFEYSVRW
jgi:hypothetical protein